MSNDIILLIGVAAPVVLLTLFRINAVMVFLSLCLGEVMVRYVAGNANSLLTWLAPNMTTLHTSFVQVGVLLFPVVLVSIFSLFSIHGHIRTLMNILPAVGVGLLGVLLVVPLLPPGAKFAIQDDVLWQQLTRLQSLIIGVSSLLTLFFFWSQRRHGHHHAEK